VPNYPTVVGLSDVGQTRSRNEDSLSLLPDLGVAVVADGMGGHPGGDIASRVAAETASRVLGEELADGVSGAEDPATLLGEIMRRSVVAAHEAIRVEGQKDPELEGMGTTITAMAVDPQSGSFVLGNVGDSRAYRFRKGELVQLTRDDTWVQERVDAEQLTADQARRHPFAHLLTQCLGLEDTPVPHLTHGSVELGDSYLLCSDGLVGMLEDPELAEILDRELSTNGTTAEAGHRESAVKALIDAANKAGGFDNITAVLVTIDAEE
jgi:serine/threonine protein phosphatase PrpC